MGNIFFSRKTIHDTKSCLVQKVEYDDFCAGVKSFHWNYSDDGIEFFYNEIITYQLIQERDASLSTDESRGIIKFPSIAQYMGFILNDISDPYFASIVIKWYPMGDLSTYTRYISNPRWFAKTDERIKVDEINEFILTEEKKNEMPKEIEQLVELAKQIAQGNILDF